MDYCEDFVEIDLGAEEEDYSEELEAPGDALETSESNVSDEDALGDANDIAETKQGTNDIVETKHNANDIAETKQGTNDIAETKHNANDIAETNKLPSVKQIGPVDTTKKHLFDKFYKYLSKKDIKNVRRMLRDYNIFVNLDTRDLNSKYPLDDYKFTKRNGVLTLYKPVNEKAKPRDYVEQSSGTSSFVPSYKEPMSYAPAPSELFSEKSLVLHIDNKIADIELSVSEFVKSIESRLQNLENRLDNYRDALNNVIRNVNANTIDTDDNTNKINAIANVVDNHTKLINNILKHFRIY